VYGSTHKIPDRPGEIDVLVNNAGVLLFKTPTETENLTSKGGLDAGKPFTVAFTAAMRKLLTALNAMVCDQKPWNARPVTTWL